MVEEKWTKEVCYEIAKQCKTKKELREFNLTVYTKANKKGWSNEYTWLVSDMEKIDDTLRIHLVYIYLDEDNKTCYIGRTKNLRITFQESPLL